MTNPATQPNAARDEGQTQHTPGPWLNDGGTITREYHASRIVIARIEHAPTIGHILTGRFGDEREGAIAANARLIAAAPDLLATLSAFVADAEFRTENATPGFLLRLAKAHAVINRATGAVQ